MVLVAGLGAAIAVGAGSSFLKSMFGRHQYKKGLREMETLDRPEYVIPEEVAANMTAAELAALEGLPAEQKQAYVENIKGTTANLIGEMPEGLKSGAASGLLQQQTRAFRELLGMDVAARKQGQQDLAQARLTSAGFKERQFDINQMQPYMQDYMAAQSMMGAGMQNIGGGLQDITQLAGIGAMAYGGQEETA